MLLNIAFQLVANFFQKIAEGRITGSRIVHLLGYNPDIDAANNETIWSEGGNYNFLIGATNLDVYSSDADDAVGGAGTTAVLIEGLDGDYNEISEVVAMDGVTPVKTEKKYLRVNRMVQATSGSVPAGANTGVIKADEDVGGLTVAHMRIGTGRAEQAVYTVPKGHEAYIHNLHGGIIDGPTANGHLIVKIKSENGVLIESSRAVSLNGVSSFDKDMKLPLKVSEKSDIFYEGDSDAANTVMNAGFALYLKKSE